MERYSTINSRDHIFQEEETQLGSTPVAACRTVTRTMTKLRSDAFPLLRSKLFKFLANISLEEDELFIIFDKISYVLLKLLTLLRDAQDPLIVIALCGGFALRRSSHKYNKLTTALPDRTSAEPELDLRETVSFRKFALRSLSEILMLLSILIALLIGEYEISKQVDKKHKIKLNEEIILHEGPDTVAQYY